MESVEARVLAITSEQMGLPVERLTRKMSFIHDMNVDPLDIVELFMEVEEAFELRIPDEVAERLYTVGDVIDFVERELKNRLNPGS